MRMQMGMTYGVAALAALLGAALGSYAAVVGERGWRRSWRGRSACAVCSRRLAWFEVVPVLSYLGLRGRCRSCGVKIPARLLAYEVAGAIMAAMALLLISRLVGCG